MPSPGVTFEDVRAAAREFSDLSESTAYGQPAIKLGKHLVACIPANKSAEPGSLALRIDDDHRAALLEEDPETYYLTDHYVNYSFVLVRLHRLRPDQVRGLIAGARQFVLAQSRPVRTQSRSRAS